MKKPWAYCLLLLLPAAAILARPGWLSSLFSSNYVPHRFCYLMRPGLVWTNAVSDGLIFLSYAVIFYGLFRLAYLVRKQLRRRLWLFLAFGTFILACGMTHLMEVITVWLPLYPLSAAIKVVCVLASVPTAIAFLMYVKPIAADVEQYLREMQTNRQALIASERLAAVGRMSASITHEINNPLDSVMNLVHIVKTHPGLPPELQQTVILTEREIGNIAKIANNTLKLYRESPSLVRVNLAEVVDSVLSLEQGKLRQRRIVVDVHSPAGAPTDVEVMAHPGELRQVLVNLVENAIAAMQEGGRLRIMLRPAASAWQGQSGVVLRVADSGTGIAPEAMPKLFDPFFTTKGEKGTGLGLWVTRQIVEKHGGVLRVRSRVGHGTTFSLWFPQGGPLNDDAAAQWAAAGLYPPELDSEHDAGFDPAELHAATA
jgi:signal transduction histidine kinase